MIISIIDADDHDSLLLAHNPRFIQLLDEARACTGYRGRVAGRIAPAGQQAGLEYTERWMKQRFCHRSLATPPTRRGRGQESGRGAQSQLAWRSGASALHFSSAGGLATRVVAWVALLRLWGLRIPLSFSFSASIRFALPVCVTVCGYSIACAPFRNRLPTVLGERICSKYPLTACDRQLARCTRSAPVARG